MNNTATYEAFLAWHKEATDRLQDGEALAAPSQKFFESWARNREARAASAAAHNEGGRD